MSRRDGRPKRLVQLNDFSLWNVHQSWSCSERGTAARVADQIRIMRMRGPAACLFWGTRSDGIALLGHSGIGKGNHIVAGEHLSRRMS